MSSEVLAIIVNYDSDDSIKRLINDDLNDFSCDISIVDNSSSSELSEWASERPIYYIDPKSNLGYAGGNNLAIDKNIEKYKYFWILNPDVKVLDIDSLKPITSVMEENPSLGIISPKIRGDNNGEYNLPSRFEDLLRRLQVLPSLKSGVDSVEYVDHVPGSAMLVRSEVIEQVGMLSEDFFLYVEETELCYRARQHGFVVGFHKDTKVRHYGSGSDLPHNNDYQIYYRTRNRFLLARERFEGSIRLKYYLSMVILDLYEATNIVKSGRLDLIYPMLQGFVDGLLGRFGERRYLFG